MNKKEIAFLKKQINEDNGSFTVDNTLLAIINQNEIMYQEVKPLYKYQEDESNELLEIIKKTLTGKLGKIVTEYEFAPPKGEPSKSQAFLMDLIKSGFRDASLNSRYLDTIKDTVEYVGTYTVVSIVFTITYIDKDTKDVTDLKFIATAFCPITLRIDGLVYDDTVNAIQKKNKSDRILEKPTDGFIFPTISDLAADVNHVMYYGKNASKPNISIIEGVLGCKYMLSAEQQRVNFWGITASVLGDELTFDMIASINERLSDEVASSALMSVAKELDCADMQHLLAECGINDEQLENIGNLYEKQMGSRHATFLATNCCDDKVGIKTGSANINIDYRRAARNLDVRMIDGKKCLVLPLESSDISILGISTKV